MEVRRSGARRSHAGDYLRVLHRFLDHPCFRLEGPPVRIGGEAAGLFGILGRVGVPAARARLNTILVGTMFVGGAFGSAAATMAWTWDGWAAVCANGLGLCVASLAIRLITSRAASARG